MELFPRDLKRGRREDPAREVTNPEDINSPTYLDSVTVRAGWLGIVNEKPNIAHALHIYNHVIIAISHLLMDLVTGKANIFLDLDIHIHF